MNLFKKSTTKPSQTSTAHTSVQPDKGVAGSRVFFLKKLHFAIQSHRLSAQQKTIKKPTAKTKPVTKMAYAKKPAQKKRFLLMMIFLLVVVPAAVPAHASIFDPLLKILLPFYKGGDEIKIDETDTTKDSEPATQTTSIQSLEPSSAPNPKFSLEPAQPNKNNQTNSPASNNALDDEFKPFDDGFSNVDLANLATDTPDLFILMQAEFAADRGDMTTALQLYKAESLKQNATAVFERALELSLQYEPVTASLDFAKRWSDKNPQHVPAWFYVAHLALKAQDYHTAAATLNRILALDANADLTQILTGIFPSDFRSQTELFHALHSTDSDNNASLSVLKAGLLMQMNEPVPARLHADNALRLSPNNLAILTLKADILYNTGQKAALDKFLTQARASTTGNTQKELYLYEIRHLIDEKNLNKAWQLLRPASQKFSDDGELVLLASLVALDIGEYAAANERLTALSHNPMFESEAHYYLGVSDERTGKHSQALAHYKKVTTPQLIWDATQKIVAYELIAGNISSAMATLTNLRKEHPAYTADSYILQADILLRQNEHDAAVALLNDAVKDEPNSTALLYNLANLLDDDNAKKSELLDTLIALEPDNPSYQLALARHRLNKNPDDYPSLSTAQLLSQVPRQDPSYNSDIQRQALQLLAQNALSHKNYTAVLEYLQTPYELKPELTTGILLLRAYQGLNDMTAVNRLLADLQTRFGGGTVDTSEESDSIDNDTPTDGNIDELDGIDEQNVAELDSLALSDLELNGSELSDLDLSDLSPANNIDELGETISSNTVTP